VRQVWERVAGVGLIDPAVDARVRERLDEQLRCAEEWCDQINAYFFRKSGVPDAHGRPIH
jgi:alpha-glucuronidase